MTRAGLLVRVCSRPAGATARATREGFERGVSWRGSGRTGGSGTPLLRPRWPSSLAWWQGRRGGGSRTGDRRRPLTRPTTRRRRPRFRGPMTAWSPPSRGLLGHVPPRQDLREIWVDATAAMTDGQIGTLGCVAPHMVWEGRSSAAVKPSAWGGMYRPPRDHAA